MKSFDERPTLLPRDDDYSRLRAMVCDPGTVFTYWQAGAWRGDGWRVRAVSGAQDIAVIELASESRETWVRPSPDTTGEIILETLRAGAWVEVARVPFTTPTDRPRSPAAEPRFGRPSGGPPGPAPKDAPELEDVVMEARLYHGRVWREGGEA